jgi:NAD(P)-dependent dehydrogenase (short-subunit alcohol dehydrogenase family)
MWRSSAVVFPTHTDLLAQFPIHIHHAIAQRVAQRVALITGSSSGIGRVTAISLAANGWNVILSGRRESELQETAQMCAEKAQGGVTTLAVPGDVGQEENVKAMFDMIKEVGLVIQRGFSLDLIAWD